MSILARESPGPGNCNPLKGGIGDKIIIQQARLSNYHTNQLSNPKFKTIDREAGETSSNGVLATNKSQTSKLNLSQAPSN